MNKLLFKLSDVYMKEELYNKENPENESLLFGDICLNRVVGIAYNNILKIENFNVSKEFMETLKIIYNYNINKAKKFSENIEYIANIMEDADFNYALLKGAFLTTKIYPVGFRTSNDIDILVAEKDVTKCQNLLKINGFIQGYYNEISGITPASRRDIIMSKMNYGETVPFLNIINNEKIEIDINFSVDFKPEGENLIVQKLLQNSEYVTYNGTKFKTLSNIDFLIHLCCHLFKEATTKVWIDDKRDIQLYKFSDINVFFHECLKEEHYNKLVDRIIEFHIENECYYTFFNTAVIYPDLKRIDGFNRILEHIKPRDMSFMSQVIDPMEKKIYEYKMNFEDWCECRNRSENLIFVNNL